MPIDVLPAGTVLHRIHRASLGTVFFGPGPGVPPTYRFDSASSRFGVLYVGLNRAGAVAETLLRNPQRLMVATSEITDRAATELACRRELRVVKLYGSGLQAVGTDNAISTGPYEPCGLWSDALWDHPDQLDGIAYQSRHESNQICLALFERPDMAFDIRSTTPLTAMLHEVAALLDAYGKSLSPA
ncbi:RES family NAD+ phosphorylase [Microvirga sp. 2TAF3]|uniref:RES family NAD+ phosphorylase n=1 Tax=Microvirga sp. 2TAF3 TaxID=3233014 RepID=UPI003F9892E6